MLFFEDEFVVKEKNGFLWGQNLFDRGNPIRNIGNVNKGNNGALKNEAKAKNTIPKGIKNIKLIIIAISAFLDRCFFTVHAVIFNRKNEGK